ncbi:DNA topoisomerase 1 [Candidatus Entotheonellaceae bacterium PAL068K]
MAKSLIIVESPAKARTIKRHLGADYAIKASIGHVKDLPESRLGIDIANNFAPEYVIVKGKKKVLQELRDEAKKAERVFLAPDPDREGEAIAWHIANELHHVPKAHIYRVLLHEITQKGITEALQHPSRIDEDKVSAQQARRLLDRLVGYKISPLLWEKVQRGLSAGRVQSVALRIICEREQAIQAFQPQEYWTIDADVSAADPPPFRARLHAVDGKKAKIPTGEAANRIVADLQGADYRVTKVKETTRRRHPAPPFTTSTLQQEAARKLRFSTQHTMRVAQQLYEGLPLGDEGAVGLITYMRTDSTRVAVEAVQEAQQHIRDCYGKDYVVSRSRQYKKQKAAQEAHEAIRPTSVLRLPADLTPYLTAEQRSLYTLIWNRFVASQMSSAILDHTSIDIEAKQYLFRATGAVMRFPGFTTLYEESAPEAIQDHTGNGGQNRTLPPVGVDQEVQATAVVPTQHFTQPPPRFTEASLVSELEKLGIGRPSTYAAILSTLRDRQYVRDQERKLLPTELGTTINVLLVENFPAILDVQFTAQLEDKLDRIEKGTYQWVETLQNFYEPFAADLAQATQKMRDIKREVEVTDEVCDKCHQPMVIRWGRFGRFLACSGFPECKNTREITADATGNSPAAPSVEVTCEKCGRLMALKRGRYGEFLACTGYPECKSTRPVNVAMPCPEVHCTGHIVQRKSRRGRAFYGCTNYPDCTFSVWQRPVPKTCPQCQSPYLLEKRASTKRAIAPILQCPSPACGYRDTADTTSVA